MPLLIVEAINLVDKILALHPDPDKQPTRIDRHKYELTKAAMLDIIAARGVVPFKDLAPALEARLGERFEGSVSWYCTTVKLDLEARGLIERVPGASPQQVRPAGK